MNKLNKIFMLFMGLLIGLYGVSQYQTMRQQEKAQMESQAEDEAIKRAAKRLEEEAQTQHADDKQEGLRSRERQYR